MMYRHVLLFVFGFVNFCLAQLHSYTPSSTEMNGMDLQHLHVLFRHGDRSPIIDMIYPQSISKNFWPSGYGQLTELGVKQEYELGLWLRDKYGKFIPPHYNASDFHMRSTDIDRTLMSAQSVLAGVYPNVSSPLTKFGLNWMPVPVHTVSQEADVLLSTAPCPCLDLLRKVQMNSEEGVSYEKKHASLFELLSKKLNTTIDRFNIWAVSDTLICMKANDVTLPDWYTDQIFNEIIEVDTFYWNLQFAQDREIVQLEIGVFLNTVMDHLTSIVKGTKFTTVRPNSLSVQHTMAYSAHDSDIVYLLSALNAFDKTLVKYSGAVVLELRGPKPPGSFEKFKLYLLYKRGYTDPQGKYLSFGPCVKQRAEDGCPLDKVLDFLQQMLVKPDDFSSVCGLEQDGHKIDKSVFPSRYSHCTTKHPTEISIFITIGVILLVCVTITVASLIYCRLRRRRLDPDRARLIDPTA